MRSTRCADVTGVTSAITHAHAGVSASPPLEDFSIGSTQGLLLKLCLDDT
jgi:hypothetical protein